MEPNLSPMLVLIIFASHCLVRSEVTSATLPCCENGRVLDLELFKCVLSTTGFATEAYTEETKATDPSLNCSHGWASFTADVKPTSALTESIFSQADKYCFHIEDENQNNINIIHCQPEPIEVKKCCPFGFAVNRTSIGECVQTEKTFNGTLFVQPSDRIVTVQPNVSLDCYYDYNVFLPKKYIDHRFRVLDSGELYVETTSYKLFRYSANYCIDSSLSAAGEEEPIAITCLPRRFYIVRSILYNIYPYTQLFSAFLLLLTLLVYIAFGTLRNNLQGKAMICFLISLFIVQSEYGILLSLPAEPHIWCSVKKHAAIYFRSATSTWITVMGFIIWRQLNTLKKAKQKNEWLEFLLLSIYGWGLPFLWYFVVKYNMNHPEDGEICCSYNPTVRLLMQMPSIVLVTLNLVFLIPTVAKVHGSLKFLRKAVTPVEMSQIERQRFVTIFRFFLLMQLCAIHYTLPSIVNEIFDFNAAGPELVFYIVCFTQFIGPVMFYFFVCKPDVLGMISKAIGVGSLKTFKVRRSVMIGFLNGRHHQSYATSEQELPVCIDTGCYKSLEESTSSLSTTASMSSVNNKL